MEKLEDGVKQIYLSLLSTRKAEYERMKMGAARFGIGAAYTIAGFSMDYFFDAKILDTAFIVTGSAYMGWNIRNAVKYATYKWNEHKRKGEQE